MRIVGRVFLFLAIIISLPFLNFGLISLYGFLKMAEEHDIKNADYFLVPGAGRNYPESPNPNYYFLGRVDKTAELHEAYPDIPIILSGYEDGEHYREAHDLKDALIRKGGDWEDLILDTVSRNSHATIGYYRDNFPDKKVVIISQKMHLERILWLAGTTGIQAMGCEATGFPGGEPRWFIYREFGARIKASLVAMGLLKPESSL